MNKIAKIYRKAIGCRMCFTEETGLKAPIIDVAQPRWIGENYQNVRPRITFIMINPGAGDRTKDAGNHDAQEVLYRFSDGVTTFADVMSFQRQHMQTWGRPCGRFLRFYVEDLNLKLDDIAFLNIALCATLGNCYPKWMLNQCLGKYTGMILQELNLDLVVLCGINAQQFSKEIVDMCPRAKVVPMIHHAHRKGREVEEREQAKLRGVIDAFA